MSALIQLAQHVYIYPGDPDPNRTQPNVGVIVTPNHTVLIDAGNSPRVARRVLLALDELHAPPINYVIYTHSHWDHVFGAGVFSVPAIGHELCRKQLVDTASKPWSQAYIQEEIQRTPAREASLKAMSRAIEDWRSFHIVVPEITLSRLLRLYLDDLTLEIEHVGGQHAPESVVVRAVEARVIFLGDCYYPPPAHLRRPNDTLDWELIKTLSSDNLDIYVDGHNPPRTRDEFRQLALEQDS
ncbi:MAG TPA: MBL fold metallo-hydrolase [Phototrophicaceae bacterium]|nr:MBL fold metallo-hydrolase [Phototrophicaceae bacterium]